MKSAIQRTLTYAHLVEDGLLILSLAGLLFVAVLQIFLRNFFDTGIVWAESFLRVLVLWVTILGAMVATREKRHIKIDVLARYLPDSYQPLLAVVTGFSGAVICGLVTYNLLLFVSYEFEDGTVAFAGVPVWLCQSILPLGFAVMTVRFVGEAVGTLHRYLLGYD